VAPTAAPKQLASAMATAQGPPRIDLARWLHGDAAEQAAVAAEWDDAMRHIGAAVVVNHGLPSAVTSALYTSASQFFSQNGDAKMAACLHQGYGPGGYVPQGVEAVGRSRAGGERAVPDLVESVVFSHGGDPSKEKSIPAYPPTLQPAVAAYSVEITAILATLLRLSAAALDLPVDYFDSLYLEGASCNLKLSWYAGIPPGTDEKPKDAMRYAPHTDCALPPAHVQQNTPLFYYYFYYYYYYYYTTSTTTTTAITATTITAAAATTTTTTTTFTTTTITCPPPG